jgi:hypothetical protein
MHQVMPTFKYSGSERHSISEPNCCAEVDVFWQSVPSDIFNSTMQHIFLPSQLPSWAMAFVGQLRLRVQLGRQMRTKIPDTESQDHHAGQFWWPAVSCHEQHPGVSFRTLRWSEPSAW